MAKSAPLHFRRIELKYRIPRRVVPFLLSAIRPYVGPDPHLKDGKEYPVCSLYYDSIDLQAYHEKLAGILSRCKVRLRTYAPTFKEGVPVFLEVKRRWDLAISKDRFQCPPSVLKCDVRNLKDVVQTLMRDGESDKELFNELQLLSHWYNLQPAVLVRYKRQPFIGRHDKKFRITLDSDIESVWKPPHTPVGDLNFHACLPHEGVLELKSNHNVPQWFHQIVGRFQLERLSVSKYALAVQTHCAIVTPTT
jgi:hypothetical protein